MSNDVPVLSDSSHYDSSDEEDDVSVYVGGVDLTTPSSLSASNMETSPEESPTDPPIPTTPGEIMESLWPVSAALAEDAYENAAWKQQAGAYDSDEDCETKLERVRWSRKHEEEIQCLQEDEDPVLLDDRDQKYLDVAAAVMKKEMKPVIEGAPPGWKPEGPPDDWKEKIPKGKCPKTFAEVPNPGGYKNYNYTAKYDKNNKYKGHSFAAGGQTLPVDEKTGRYFAEDDWEGFYDGWDRTYHLGHKETPFRSGAGKNNMFPEERRGKLSVETLKKLGCTKQRIADGDALFFDQIIRPICDPARSGTPGDPRLPYYSKVVTFSNSYAHIDLKMNNGYGHYFQPTTIKDWVHWDGILMSDGSKNGSDGAILSRWDPEDPLYNEDIEKTMGRTQFCLMKRIFHLCHNHDHVQNKEAKGYDPAYKYQFIYDVTAHNCNAVTARAADDVCYDESSYSYFGHGPGIFRIANKKVKRGGQIGIFTDCNEMMPRAFIFRHKREVPKDCELKRQGQCEFKLVLDALDKLLVDPITGEGVFYGKPHITCDDYFSGEKVLKEAARRGYSCLMTTARDRLPKGIDAKNLQKLRVETNWQTKVTQYETPIVFIKEYEGQLLQLCSFQSTGACNISGVNSINS